MLHLVDGDFRIRVRSLDDGTPFVCNCLESVCACYQNAQCILNGSEKCDNGIDLNGSQECDNNGINVMTCGHAFAQKSQLWYHNRAHIGNRRYKCSTCEKTYSSHLARHERIHTGVKPYSCSTCEKTFSHKFCFTKHEKIHTGVKPYRCCKCEKTFTQKSKLTNHERIHTGEKPYRCSKCEKTFTQKYRENSFRF